MGCPETETNLQSEGDIGGINDYNIGAGASPAPTDGNENDTAIGDVLVRINDWLEKSV